MVVAILWDSDLERQDWAYQADLVFAHYLLGVAHHLLQHQLSGGEQVWEPGMGGRQLFQASR